MGGLCCASLGIWLHINQILFKHGKLNPASILVQNQKIHRWGQGFGDSDPFLKAEDSDGHMLPRIQPYFTYGSDCDLMVRGKDVETTPTYIQQQLDGLFNCIKELWIRMGKRSLLLQSRWKLLLYCEAFKQQPKARIIRESELVRSVIQLTSYASQRENWKYYPVIEDILMVVRSLERSVKKVSKNLIIEVHNLAVTDKREL